MTAPAFFDAFQQVCATAATRTAIDDNGDLVTYQQLWETTSALASRLRNLGVTAQSRVAVHEERGAPAVAAYLAVLHVGATFVPIDVDLPAERKAALVRDCSPSLILGRDTPVALPVEPLRFATASTAPGPHWRGPSEHPAYLLYTSGTTGHPKGAVLRRRGIDYLSETMPALLGITQEDRVAQVSALSFDASIFEIFSTLRAGATLVILGRRRFGSTQEMIDLVDRTRCSVALITPTALLSSANRDMAYLRLLLAGGERLPAELAARWGRRRLLYNLYGPTECTVIVGGHRYDPRRDYGPRSIPIGDPLPGYRWSLRDADGSPAASGAGELWVAGPGVAGGYLNRPQETARAFVPDADGSVWYRTGDLVRQVGPNEFEYQGRIDHQVKVRGYRIELAEIDECARALPWVRAAAAVPLRGRATPDQLALCYVRESLSDHPDPAAAIRSQLRAALPHYMVPTRIREVASLPVTSSGKIDRAALADLLSAHHGGDTAERGKGSNPLDQLSRTWNALLGSTHPEENFFALGGDSLIAAELEAALERITGRRAPAGLVSRTFTLRDLLRAARDLAADPPARSRQAVSGTCLVTGPVSFAQKARLSREWHEGAGRRVIPITLSVHDELDLDRLREAVRAVAQRHPALRTTFRRGRGGHFTQRLLPAIPLPVEDEPLGREDMDELLGGTITALSEHARRPFPFAGEGFLRVVHAHDDERHVIVLVTEHLVFDGWSVRMLLDDLAYAYDGSPLPAPGLSPADFAAAQHLPEPTAEREMRIAHWRAALAGRPLAPPFAPDWPTGTGGSRLGALVIGLSPSATARVRAHAAELLVSPHTYLVAATLSWLKGVSRGPGDGLIVTYHGRETPAERGVVGNFADVISLRAAPAAGVTPAALVTAAGAAMHTAQANFVPYAALRAAVAPGEAPHEFLSFELRSPRYFEHTTTLWRFVDPKDTDPPFGGAKILFDDRGETLRLCVRYDAGRYQEQAVAASAEDLAALVREWGRG